MKTDENTDKRRRSMLLLQ